MRVVLTGLLFGGQFAFGQVTRETFPVKGEVFQESPRLSVPRALVKLTPIPPSSATESNVVTGVQGEFQFQAVVPGKYRLSASKPGFSVNRRSSQTITVQPDGTVQEQLSLELTPLSILFGSVVDESDQPLTGVRVRVFRQEFRRGHKSWSVIGPPTSVDEDGRFRIANLLPGRYAVGAEAGEGLDGFGFTYHPSALDFREAIDLELPAGTEKPANVRLRKRPGFFVSGKVEFPGLPSAPSSNDNTPAVPSLMLQLRASNSEPGLSGDTRLATVFSDGAFQYRNIPAGEYILEPSYVRLRVSTPTGTFNIKTVWFGQTKVIVGDRSIENLILPLKKGLTLKGNIVFEEPAPQNRNLEKLWVQLQPGRLFGPEAYSRPSANGQFQFADVAPEPYTLQISGLGDGVFVKSIQVGRRRVVRRDIDLSSEDSGDLQIVLSNKSASASGLVRDAREKVQKDGLVAAIRRSERGIAFPEVLTTRTDAQGRFEFKGLEPGEWDFVAWDEVDPQSIMRGSVLENYHSKFKTVALAESSRSDGIQLVALFALPSN
jgi:hypothetical protein